MDRVTTAVTFGSTHLIRGIPYPRYLATHNSFLDFSGEDHDV
jgi:hypothetical protein